MGHLKRLPTLKRHSVGVSLCVQRPMVRRAEAWRFNEERLVLFDVASPTQFHPPLDIHIWTPLVQSFSISVVEPSTLEPNPAGVGEAKLKSQILGPIFPQQNLVHAHMHFSRGQGHDGWSPARSSGDEHQRQPRMPTPRAHDGHVPVDQPRWKLGTDPETPATLKSRALAAVPLCIGQ